MPQKHKVATEDDFTAEGARVIAEIEGQEIAIFYLDDEYYALANYCIHQGGPLCEGKVRGQMTAGEDRWSWEFDTENKVVECPWHGWLFDVKDGYNTADSGKRTPTYEVEVSDGDVYVLR